MDETNVLNWPVERIIDNFVSDVLLPSTTSTMGGRQLYNIFGEYCNQIGLGIPCGNAKFGAILKNRLQKRRLNGRAFYYCEVNPKVIAGEGKINTMDELRVIEIIQANPDWEIRELPDNHGIYVGPRADYIEEQVLNTEYTGE